MANKTTKTGKQLERQVADAYRAVGARRVEHDVEITGHQIDVYVEMETADRSLHRIAIEAKDHARPVGIGIIAGFADVVDGLRRLGRADEGVVVSASGYSRQARNAAREHGLRLLEAADLEALPDAPHDAAGGRATPLEADAGLPGAPSPLGRASGSPFVVGRPLRASEPIFGRDDLFRSVAGQLANFSSVNVVGQRRMGKTSVLNHLIGRQQEYLIPQPDQPPLLLACIDLQAEVSNAERFYGRALRELLDRLPPDQSAEACELQDLRERLHARPEADYDAFERALRRLRDPGDVCIRPVLMVDEFARLIEPAARDGFPYPDFFNGLRALITANLLAMVIFSCRPLADFFRDPDRPENLTSTFPTYFTPFPIHPLENDAADELLLQPSDHTLTLEQVTQAKRWAGGHPCHLQVAGMAWYEARAGGRTSRWARRRFKYLRDQDCMVGGTLRQRPARPGWLGRALRFVFCGIPIRIGRLAQRLGARIDDAAAWLIGAAVIVVGVLVLLGVAQGDDLLAVIKRGLGLR